LVDGIVGELFEFGTRRGRGRAQACEGVDCTLNYGRVRSGKHLAKLLNNYWVLESSGLYASQCLKFDGVGGCGEECL